MAEGGVKGQSPLLNDDAASSPGNRDASVVTHDVTSG